MIYDFHYATIIIIVCFIIPSLLYLVYN